MDDSLKAFLLWLYYSVTVQQRLSDHRMYVPTSILA